MDKPLKVLVVDDEAFNVDYLIQELEDFGVHTFSAEDGIEALKQIDEHSPDLVLLDIMMPKMDGFGVLAEMKSKAELRDIPVIVISAHRDMQHVLKGIEMGAEDYLPKPFDPLLLKARVNASLEKKRLRNVEKRYFESIERELQIGREIQQGFLPEEIEQPEGWEIATFFRAAREVSGDFYDVFSLGEGNVAFLVGDVTDKGVGAALYMALYRSLLRTALSGSGFAGQGTAKDMSEAAAFVNSYICEVHHSKMYLTVFIAILEAKSGRLAYVNAGHDLPLLVRGDGSIEELTPTGPAIGVFGDREFAVGETAIGGGDTLLVFTDGLTDIRNAEGSSFGTEKVLKLAGKKLKSAESLIGKLVSEVDRFSNGVAQYDDLTILGVRRSG